MSSQETIAAAIERHRMLDRGRRIGVAVSGGADSLFLLHALHGLGLAACILHVNHQLRGAESDADESFAAGLAADFHIPFFAITARPPEGNLEQEARRTRYRFFAGRIAGGVCDAVATGHTLDDQAETVLSRFLRGSGTAGLAGIQPVTAQNMIRPQLGIRRSEIRDWLRSHDIAWREDRSNESTEYLRNRLRLEILPKLAEINPSLSEVLASTAEWAAAEESWWEAQLDLLTPGVFTSAGEAALCRTAALNAEPVAVQRRVLRRVIAQIKGSLRGIDFRHVEAIRRLAGTTEGSGRIQLPGLDIYRSFDWLRLAPPGIDTRLERDFEAPLSAPGTTNLPDRLLTIEMELVNSPTVYNGGMDVVDRERTGDALIVRNWRPGDSYTPSGKSGPVKIKTLFQEFRIPLWQRRHWPVIARGSEIVWARRFGTARGFAAGPATKEGLLIREVSADSGESNAALRTSTEMNGSLRAGSSRENPVAGADWRHLPDAAVSSGEAK